MKYRAFVVDSADRLAQLESDLARARHTEEESRQSGERFRLLIEHGHEFVFRYGFHPRGFEYVSPGVADLCGYSASEFYANPDLVLDIVHPHDRAVLQEYIDESDYSRPLALRCRRPDGEIVWVEQRALPSYGPQGELVALEGIVRDVSNYRHLLEGSERPSVSVEERRHLLQALHQIGTETLESLELDHVLDTLAHQVVRAGILRSLMVALVDHQNHVVRVARNYLSFDGSYEEGIGHVRPGAQITPSPTVAHREGERLVFSDQRIIGTTYDLDDDNITPTVARTGEFTVIDGPDERFDERFEHKDKKLRSGSVSYFIPVQREGRVLAVLATGSQIEDREETLGRIEAMAPLLEQAAVALDHALTHGRVRDQARELHDLNGRLREEVSRRLQAEETLRDFSQRTVGLAEEERRRVARELHDGVNQLLCAVGFGLEAAGLEVGDQAQASLDQTRELLDRTIREVRRISQDLRPGVLDDLGLAPAIRSLCDGFAQRTGLTVTHSLEQVPKQIPPEIAITVYRMLQEALHYRERLEEPGGITILIRTDESGAMVSELADEGDLHRAISVDALQYMRERAGLLGGTVAIESPAEGGTRLSIHLPWPLERTLP